MASAARACGAPDPPPLHWRRRRFACTQLGNEPAYWPSGTAPAYGAYTANGTLTNTLVGWQQYFAAAGQALAGCGADGVTGCKPLMGGPVWDNLHDFPGGATTAKALLALNTGGWLKEWTVR